MNKVQDEIRQQVQLLTRTLESNWNGLERSFRSFEVGANSLRKLLEIGAPLAVYLEFRVIQGAEPYLKCRLMDLAQQLIDKINALQGIPGRNITPFLQRNRTAPTILGARKTQRSEGDSKENVGNPGRKLLEEGVRRGPEQSNRKLIRPARTAIGRNNRKTVQSLPTDALQQLREYQVSRKNALPEQVRKEEEEKLKREKNKKKKMPKSSKYYRNHYVDLTRGGRN